MKNTYSRKFNGESFAMEDLDNKNNPQFMINI